MSNEITTSTNSSLSKFSPDQMNLIRTQIAKNCTDVEIEYFLEICKQYDLNPFTKQIYAIKRGNQMSIQTGIDGFRSIAHRTGKCLSISDAEFKYDKNGSLVSATTVVEKLVGDRVGKFTATAYFSDYYGDGKSIMANSKPRIMLGKCSESLAIRKSFSQELSGIYTHEEMVIADKEQKIDIVENVVDPVAIEREANREEFDKMATFITKQIAAIWPKLVKEQRISLFNDLLKIKEMKDIERKSLSQLKECFTEFNIYLSELTDVEKSQQDNK